MELAASFIFAVSGVALMCLWQCSAAAVVVAYGTGCLLTAARRDLLAAAKLGKLARGKRPPPPSRAMWSQLLPFAVWLMMINLLTTLFDLADRQMIIHCSAGDALAEVGNYRSSRVVPLLLTSVTAMIAGVATPHLSFDWEAGRRGRVSDQLNLLLKVLAAGLTLGGVLILAAAPWLFEVAFRGKYAGGLAVMPWTLIYCTWFGLAIVAQKYLWCAERAGRVSVALVVGLAINVALNFALLPRLGLLGAVLATAAAHFTALMLIVTMSSRLGFRVDRGTLGGAAAAGGAVPRGVERLAGAGGRRPGHRRLRPAPVARRKTHADGRNRGIRRKAMDAFSPWSPSPFGRGTG